MTLRIVAITVAIIVTVSCKEQPSPAQKDGGLPGHHVASSTQPNDTLARNDSLMNVLVALQTTICLMPGKQENIQAFLKVSFDSVTGCCSVVGKGTYNNKQPEAVWEKGRKIAASYDGQRWALYCKSWLLGNKTRFGASIAGQITYSSVAYEKLVNDSLYQLLLIPFGSIVLD